MFDISLFLPLRFDGFACGSKRSRPRGRAEVDREEPWESCEKAVRKTKCTRFRMLQEWFMNIQKLCSLKAKQIEQEMKENNETSLGP